MIVSQQKYIKSISKPYLCDIDIEKTIENYDEKLFGSFNDKIERKTFDKEISKSLCLNNKIIGGYLLSEHSMLSTVSDIIYLVENGNLSDLKFYVDQNILDSYKNKKGILSDFIYIDKRYRGNNYANILINYGKSLGDYVWGLSIPNESTEYWVNKQNRVKILEYKDEDGLVILTSTKL